MTDLHGTRVVTHLPDYRLILVLSGMNKIRSRREVVNVQNGIHEQDPKRCIYFVNVHS